MCEDSGIFDLVEKVVVCRKRRRELEEAPKVILYPSKCIRSLFVTQESWMKHKGMGIMTLKTHETDAQKQGIDLACDARQ